MSPLPAPVFTDPGSSTAAVKPREVQTLLLPVFSETREQPAASAAAAAGSAAVLALRWFPAWMKAVVGLPTCDPTTPPEAPLRARVSFYLRKQEFITLGR